MNTKTILRFLTLSGVFTLSTAQADVITYDFTANVTSTTYCCSSIYTGGDIVHGTFSYLASPMTSQDPYSTWLLSSPNYTFTAFTPNTGVTAITIPSASNPGDGWSGASVKSGDGQGGWNFYGSSGWVTGLVFDSHYNTVSEPASGWAWATISLDSKADINAADRANWVNGSLPAFSTFTSGGTVQYGTGSASTGADGYQATITSLTLISDVPSTVPVPSAVWMFGTGLLGLFGLKRQRSNRR